jgi:hypothetical protein
MISPVLLADHDLDCEGGRGGGWLVIAASGLRNQHITILRAVLRVISGLILILRLYLKT